MRPLRGRARRAAVAVAAGLASVAPRAAEADDCENVWCPPGFSCDPSDGTCSELIQTTTSAAPVIVNNNCGGPCPSGYTCQGSMCNWATVVPGMDTSSDGDGTTTKRVTSTSPPYTWRPTEDEGGGSLNLYIGIGAGVIILGLLCCLIGGTFFWGKVGNKSEKKGKKKKDSEMGWEEKQVIDHDWGLEGGGRKREDRDHDEHCHSDWVGHEVHEHHDDHSPDHAGPLHRRIDHHNEQTKETEHAHKRTHHHERARKHCKDEGPPEFRGVEVPEFAESGHAYDNIMQREKVLGKRIGHDRLPDARNRGDDHHSSPGHSPGRSARSPGREASPRSPGRHHGSPRSKTKRGGRDDH